MFPYNKKLVSNAQQLRKNMTPEEKILWYKVLKKLPVPVKRQKNIKNYILDFYIPSYRIAIEIDGVQHQTDEHAVSDKQRDETLAELGIKVIRYSNRSINDSFTQVAQNILDNLELSFDDLKE